MTPRRAFRLASGYGSYLRAGDPGASMYAFFFDDGRPVSEDHRAAVLRWLERQRDETEVERRDRLRLIEFMRSTPLRPLNPEQSP